MTVKQKSREDEVIRDLRRGFVFEWLLKGYSATPISQAWNKDQPNHKVSVKTIEADITAVMKEIAQRRLYNAAQFQNVAMMRLEKVIQALEPRVVAGELGAIDRYVNTVFKQATIMGSVAPAKLALADANGRRDLNGFMSDEERNQQLQRLFDQVRSRAQLEDEVGDVIDSEVLMLPEPEEAEL